MQDPLGIAPRRPNATPTHIEVYLPEQVAVLFKDGQLRLITHISTGSGKDWCGERTDGTKVCGTSITPGGVYKFNRRQSDWWEGDLGRMFNPVYFNYGIAVHGMTTVPNYPASHGCVRIPMHIAEYFPSLVKNGDQVFVWDGVKEPEKYGAQPPPFDTRSTRLDHHDGATHDRRPATPRPAAPPDSRLRRRRRPPLRPRRRPPRRPPTPHRRLLVHGDGLQRRRSAPPTSGSTRLQGRRNAPPASGSTHCRAERVGGGRSAAEPADEDASQLLRSVSGGPRPAPRRSVSTNWRMRGVARCRRPAGGCRP